MIGSYIGTKYVQNISESDDNNWALQHIYTHDESDISYREVNNRTDGAVKREKALKYAAKIKELRA